jgi:DNA mismatch repair protein MutL
MGRIQILPTQLINQIAAGEVVERPASVVKELVENALDAGATRIEVHVKNGGRDLRIADNGSGMDSDDLQLAFKNHATSKVSHIEDLFALQTLGFRGEALASIAAISKVKCQTRTPDSTAGLKAIVSPAGDVMLTETGCAVGTVFEISDLFYNVPARLKFMKQPKTEVAHITEALQMLALSHPNAAFSLFIDQEQKLKTFGSSAIDKVLYELFEFSSHETLLPIAFEDAENGYHLEGWTSSPNVMRGSKKWMFVFVNGRGIRCPILLKAMESAYQSLLTPGRYPVSVISLALPPEEVDVNVHPTKKEVKYANPNTLFSFVRRGLERALESVPVIQTASHTNTALPPTPQASFQVPRQTTPSANGFVQQPTYRLDKPDFSQNTQQQTLSHVQDALKLYEPLSPGTETSPFDRIQLPSGYHVLGQLRKTYIILETPDGLLIVDQHIAAERVWFERLKTQAESIEPASQVLFVPQKMWVSEVAGDQIERNRTAFEQLGFQFRIEGQQLAFSQIPTAYQPAQFKRAVEAMLQAFEETGALNLSLEDVIATAACHSSVRSGDVLNLQHMERLIIEWLQCSRPWTCPHGRPVSHLIADKALLGFFDRPSYSKSAIS